MNIQEQIKQAREKNERRFNSAMDNLNYSSWDKKAINDVRRLADNAKGILGIKKIKTMTSNDKAVLFLDDMILEYQKDVHKNTSSVPGPLYLPHVPSIKERAEDNLIMMAHKNTTNALITMQVAVHTK